MRLLAVDAELASTLRAGPAPFRERFRVRLTHARSIALLVAEQTLAGEVAPQPWGDYLAVDPATRRVVGTCGFHAVPADGCVEIAYLTTPPYEGRGHATAMAARLLEVAWSAPEVGRVRARTFTAGGASARVLHKLGFRCTGPVQDPEDGPVWAWERAR